MTTNRIQATIPIKALITFVVLFGMGVCLRFSAASVVVFRQTQNKDDSTNGARTSSNDVVTSRANYQRTGFYSARGVHDLKGIVWRTPKPFSLKKKQQILYDNLIDFDEVFFGEYGVSAPIFANGVVYFSTYVGHGYLAALDASTERDGQSLTSWTAAIIFRLLILQS